MAQTTPASAQTTGSGNKSNKPKTKEEIFAGFQALRSEQRQISNKISELEMDLTEHKIVIDTLKKADPSRRCYRMMGGVLVERTVAETLPELVTNADCIPHALEKLRGQLADKGREINQYIETHDIKIHKAEHPPEQPTTEQPASKPNVLVASG